MLIVQGAVLELEDLDFAGFLRGLEFDVGLADGEEERAAFVLGVGEEFFVLRSGEEVLDGGVAEGGEGVADGEEDQAPGEEVRADEEGAGEEQEEDVQHGAEVLV
ncbi:hypothetical protein HBI70_107620 [Parastagonospora nodorum]|nr:hypothetical protein HBH54_126530 [Parastagonospora nodorum]KAH3951311.1 hypothetical protein HBH53_060550 [Parastagonospora nodorum]KAH4032443.1 hypothetical protein HBI09_118940 [Parastagonospora nodorum]KAH4170866.1 hypothetical protein HBH43_104230 [Parastagonospora nodorum]KAH4172017.1 hypothetical protein HBH44_029680 [Parastagonospora nodorum]